MSDAIWDNKQYRELTISWNQAMCGRFENVFSQLRDMEGLSEKDLSEPVFKHSLDLIKRWYQEPSPKAGLNNAEFISRIDDLKEMVSLAATMSVYGEMVVPDLVIKGLEKFGENSRDAMVREIMRADFEASEEASEFDLTDYFSNITIIKGNFQEQEKEATGKPCGIPSCARQSDDAETAVANLEPDSAETEKQDGQPADEDIAEYENLNVAASDSETVYNSDQTDFSSCESQAPQRIAASFLTIIADPSALVYLPFIVEKLAATNKPDLAIQEAVATFLVATSYNSPEWLLEWLDNTIDNREDLSDHPVTYLVMNAIARAHHMGDHSQVLGILLRGFDFLADKASGASCLASFGDLRALPFLKSWFLIHQQQMDEKTWHEFALAIRRLGGKVDPADHPTRFH
ncbi:MAG TPA: hypothetical protein GXX72_05775 [Clostridiaceae bacterium]|nr:hypothetical protein [Clostridiaceae bacterium]